jgi:hypothetical protein
MSTPSRRWPLRAILLGAMSLLGPLSCGSDAKDDPGFATGPLMRPGDDCLRCHAAGSDYPKAKHWSLAGTVYPTPGADASSGVEGAHVLVSAPDGSLLETLTTNAVGNFYTATALPTGYRVAVEYEGQRADMPCPPPAGNCGACHSVPPIGAAPGRIAVAQGLPTLLGTFDCTSWSRR